MTGAAPDMHFLYDKIEEAVCTCPQQSDSIVIDILSQWDAVETNEILFDEYYADILRVSPAAFFAIQNSLVTLLETLRSNLDCRTSIDHKKSHYGRIRFWVFFNKKETKKRKTSEDEDYSSSSSSSSKSCSL